MSGRDWPAEGATFTVVYPFCRTEYEAINDAGDGLVVRKGWRPGINIEVGDDDCYGPDFFADAEGEMRLTVVSVHKPGKHATRVFYTRQWAAPDGKVFGKGTLHICTLEKFGRISTRYGVDYSCEGLDHDDTETGFA